MAPTSPRQHFPLRANNRQYPSLQILINRLLTHEPRGNHLRIAIRQHLARQEPRNALLAVHPPEAVGQPHPPDGVLAAPRRPSLDGQEPRVRPALRRVARLRVELGGRVDERRVRRGWAVAREVGSEEWVLVVRAGGGVRGWVGLRWLGKQLWFV